MRNKPTVIHLIDDTTAGGVVRVLDHIKTSPDMAKLADHRFVTVQRGKLRQRRFDGDIIVSHLAISWRTLPALLAIRFANHGRPFVHVEHSYTEGFVRHNVPNLRRFNTLLRIGFSLFDRIVAVSNAQADWFRRARLCPSEKLSVIRSCVDLFPFEAVAPKSTPPKVIGAIGRLDPQKGFDTLITAFRALPDNDIALHIYGTGNESDRLKALAHGDPRIEFKGFVTDPVHAYEASDIVVVPSRWEAYGLVAIEALSANRPVLCANVDGLKDHQEYGARLFDGHTTEDLTCAIAVSLAGNQRGSNGALNNVALDAQGAFVSGWRRLLDGLCETREQKSPHANLLAN